MPAIVSAWQKQRSLNNQKETAFVSFANCQTQLVRKLAVSLVAFLSIIGFLTECKDTYQDFSPGAGDPRITGTWQLAERQFPSDSAYYLIDSIFVAAHYELDSTLVGGNYVKDSVLVKDHYERDSVKTAKTVFILKKYPATPPQTITFGTDGKLSASGADMTYYYPIKYFRVDSTYDDGLGVSLFINTNRANQPFRQPIAFKQDTLWLKPKCEGSCYLKFFRSK